MLLLNIPLLLRKAFVLLAHFILAKQIQKYFYLNQNPNPELNLLVFEYVVIVRRLPSSAEPGVSAVVVVDAAAELAAGLT